MSDEPCPTCGGDKDERLRGYAGCWHTAGPDCLPVCMPCRDGFHAVPANATKETQ